MNVKSQLRNKGLALIVGMTAICVSASESRWATKYPDDIRPLVSPSGKSRIVNKDDLKGPMDHGLFLVHGDSKETLLHEYGRHVRVAWSPSGKNLVVTDYTGSDEATCLLFDIATLKNIDLASAVPDHASELQKILKSHHAYAECTRWAGDTVVEVKFTGWGNGDTKRRTQTVRYKLGQGFQLPVDRKKSKVPSSN